MRIFKMVGVAVAVVTADGIPTAAASACAMWRAEHR